MIGRKWEAKDIDPSEYTIVTDKRKGQFTCKYTGNNFRVSEYYRHNPDLLAESFPTSYDLKVLCAQQLFLLFLAAIGGGAFLIVQGSDTNSSSMIEGGVGSVIGGVCGLALLYKYRPHPDRTLKELKGRVEEVFKGHIANVKNILNIPKNGNEANIIVSLHANTFLGKVVNPASASVNDYEESLLSDHENNVASLVPAPVYSSIK